MNDMENLAAMFKALGDPTRLRIFEFLRACRCDVAVDETGDVRPVLSSGDGAEKQGPTVGEVCCQITGAERVTSTISFHLKELRQAGLITMERRGKNMICGVDEGAAARLAGYFGASEPTSNCGCDC